MNRIDPVTGMEPSQADARRVGTFSRRAFTRGSVLWSLAALGAPLGGFAGAASINGDHGRIKPSLPVPPIDLVRHDGARTTLPAFTFGHATAVQLMFTTCSTICPIQAALFARVQTLVPGMGARGMQLLSISINPEEDNVKALGEWHRRYRAGAEWIVAAANPGDTAQVQSFFGQSKANYADHSTQINIVDRQSRLIWRTNELPTAEEIASILVRV